MKKNKIYLFLLPAMALALSLWLASQQFGWFDTKIEISFVDASQIQPEKTKIIFKGVTIGVVKDIQLSEDRKNAIAKVLLYEDGKRFAVKGTSFYIVSPEISFSGVKGLETIIQGSYIAAKPGAEDAEEKYEFVGNMTSENAAPVGQVFEYTLETKEAKSISAGDSISFRGVIIGSVGGVELSKDSTKVLIKINIQNKFVKLVRTNTVFWQKEALRADVGLFGADIEVSSLETMMKGGISMATPAPAGPIAEWGAHFELLDQAPEAFKKAQKNSDKNQKEWSPLLSFDKRQ